MNNNEVEFEFDLDYDAIENEGNVSASQANLIVEEEIKQEKPTPIIS